VYGPLNDFLRPERRQVTSSHAVDGHPSVKDVIERLGVPHPEIDLILVNGCSVPFGHVVRDGDRIAVFPRFAAIDIESVTHVRPLPLATVRFAADVHLGKLARRLRLVGLDTAYESGITDATLVDLAGREGRILLTRDQGLLKRRGVSHGYFVRETRPHGQLVEVLQRFGPADVQPFSRCLRCNGGLRQVPKSEVAESLPPRTRRHYDRFHTCDRCGRIYWRGSHWKRLQQAVDAAWEEATRHRPPTIDAPVSNLGRDPGAR
jgi:uncharacterized protein with PIN domain